MVQHKKTKQNPRQETEQKVSMRLWILLRSRSSALRQRENSCQKQKLWSAAGHCGEGDVSKHDNEEVMVHNTVQSECMQILAQ